MSATTFAVALAEWSAVLLPLVVLLAYPVYILLMAGVLRVCGVPKGDIAKWALKQADRQRLIDLIRAARGLSGAEDPPKKLSPGADGTSADELAVDAREPRSPTE